ncbi:MAG: DcaP family trimeric outer membrane transporter [Ignavibacteriales bacterium]|nr:DcaP family trimeric outer membrane transporter [Ignavibacteriales bacterium]
MNGLTNTNSFSTYDIPVGDDAGNQRRFSMAPYQTRLGIEVKRTGLLNNFRIKIETDFLGANNGLRLSHAFIETGNFIIGQTWSTFTDVNSVPQTVDVDGPNSSVQLRTVRIRYADRLLQSNLRYIVSLEAPDPEVAETDSLSDRIPAQYFPDISGQVNTKF